MVQGCCMLNTALVCHNDLLSQCFVNIKVQRFCPIHLSSLSQIHLSSKWNIFEYRSEWINKNRHINKIEYIRILLSKLVNQLLVNQLLHIIYTNLFKMAVLFDVLTALPLLTTKHVPVFLLYNHSETYPRSEPTRRFVSTKLYAPPDKLCQSPSYVSCRKWLFTQKEHFYICFRREQLASFYQHWPPGLERWQLFLGFPSHWHYRTLDCRVYHMLDQPACGTASVIYP